jgi:hypothetical protein
MPVHEMCGITPSSDSFRYSFLSISVDIMQQQPAAALFDQAFVAALIFTHAKSSPRIDLIP